MIFHIEKYKRLISRKKLNFTLNISNTSLFNEKKYTKILIRLININKSKKKNQIHNQNNDITYLKKLNLFLNVLKEILHINRHRKSTFDGREHVLWGSGGSHLCCPQRGPTNNPCPTPVQTARPDLTSLFFSLHPNPP